MAKKSRGKKLHSECLVQVMESLIGHYRMDNLETLIGLLKRYDNAPEHDRLPVARGIAEALEPGRTMEAAIPASRDVDVAMNPGGWPERLALVNPISGAAFEMRFLETRRMADVKFVSRKNTPWTGKVLDRVLECGVCEAAFLRSVYVRLDGEMAKLNPGAKISLSLDDEAVLDDSPISDLLMVPDGERLPRIPSDLLFGAHALGTWIGYMLPTGTNIRAKVSGLSPKEAESAVEVELSIAIYTTR